MAPFGLAVVPEAWDTEMPLEFTAAEYAQYNPAIEAGTRIVIYMTGPVNGVVSEGVVSDDNFIHIADWPASTSGAMKRLVPDAAYLLPLRVLYRRTSQASILHQDRVRDILGDPAFPQAGVPYRVLSDGEYQELTEELV